MTGERADHAGPTRAAAPRGGSRAERVFSFAVAVAALVGLSSTIIWAAAGFGYYWPCWIWLGCAGAIAVIAIWLHFRSLPQGWRRWLVGQTDLSVAVGLYLLAIWLFTGTHGFWPLWPLSSLAQALVLHVLIFYRDRLPLLRGRRLRARIDTLTRTRRGAVDVQAAALRQIERDLHDGAQARLVALSMQLGRAEVRLADRPEEAALVRAARQEASAAIAELRDLARGIAPPVLADRGLEAAVRSLAERSPRAVTVNAERQPQRLAPAVEGAAYFVVAEALTNVAKHAPRASAKVTIAQRGDRLLIDVTDNGEGGADPAVGSGLHGLQARVEALDGTLTVISPAGGPTVIHAELPCES
jgi:signal transduction histidine kinase